jgi:hypothetical protein
MRQALVLMTVVSVAACQGSSEDQPAAETATASDSASGSDAGTSDMSAMATSQMIRDMRMSLSRTSALSPDSLKALIPEHRQKAANLIAEMNREMTSMEMSSDAPWTATIDSLREDLVRLADVDAAQLQALMPEHGRRLERLMASHEAMMKH